MRVHHIYSTVHTPSSNRNKVLIEVQQLKGKTRPNMRVACSELLLQETSLKSHHVEMLEPEPSALEHKQKNEIPHTTLCQPDLHRNTSIFFSFFK